MKNFIEIIRNALWERGKTLQDMFNDKIVSPNTFYKYNQRNPSVKTLKKIANYLGMSIDYLLELTLENNYKKYFDEDNFYINFIELQKSQKISGRKICKDLGTRKIISGVGKREYLLVCKQL